jgi:cytoskeletal protein CcmA (bactofilin family)
MLLKTDLILMLLLARILSYNKINAYFCFSFEVLKIFGDQNMIFKSQKTKENSPKSSNDYGITIITAGCHFKGKLHCKGSSRIAGTIEGELISEGMLVIEQGAVIKAEMNTEEVIVHGSITGSLHARKKVELASTSKFVGDIFTPSLIVEEGAKFDGRSSSKVSDEIANVESIHTNKKDSLAEANI